MWDPQNSASSSQDETKRALEALLHQQASLEMSYSYSF